MKKIRGEDKTVKLLLGQKFQIDYYQREYDWGQKQIEELITDLITKFFDEYDSSHERMDVANYAQYFLGPIIVSEKDGVKFIVDGQQRLTSLTLLLIYLDVIQKDNPDEKIVKIGNLIKSTQYGRDSFNLDVPERNACLEDLIRDEIPDTAGKPPSVQNLINRYHDIVSIVNEFLDELPEKGIPYFLDWLIDRVIFVEISASSDEDAYTIFETMNDRGLSLTPADMLKGFLLSQIEDSEKRNYADDVWKNQISKLRDLGKDEDANCIKAWLRSQYAEKIRERNKGAKPEDFDRLGTEFHRWVKENSERIELTNSPQYDSFITKEFLFFSQAYTIAHNASTSYREDLSSVYFNAQNKFTLQYSLMLAPLQVSDNNDTVIRKMSLVATFIEILLARRMWNLKGIGHSTMQYRAFLIMNEIRRSEFKDLRDKLINYLENEDQEDYLNFNPTQPFVLHGRNRSHVHYLLARLTSFLEEESGETNRYSEYSNRSSKKGGYQIEHIWANQPSEHKDEFESSSDFESYRDRVGGLVLLPAKENAALSDMKYNKKVEHYVKQNLLACSLHEIAYERRPGFRTFLEKNKKLKFEPKKTFHKADLDSRQELYNALAGRCWSPKRLKKI